MAAFILGAIAVFAIDQYLSEKEGDKNEKVSARRVVGGSRDSAGKPRQRNRKHHGAGSVEKSESPEPTATKPEAPEPQKAETPEPPNSDESASDTGKENE